MPSSLGIVASHYSGFSPLSLSPSAWYDASDTSTITASSGSVSEWRDKSGNARHMSQSTGSSQPSTGVTTVNGLNAIRFGSAAIMKSTSFSVSQPFTAVFVFRTASNFSSSTNSSYSILIDGSADASLAGRAILFGRRADRSNLPVISGDLTSYPSFGSALSNSTAYIFDITFNGSSSVGRLNAASATRSIGTNGIGGGIMFSGLAPETRVMGDVCEALIVARDLTSTERSNLAAYLNTKWAVY